VPLSQDGSRQGRLAIRKHVELHAASPHSGSMLVAVLVAIRPRSRLSAGVRTIDMTCTAAFYEPRRTRLGQSFNPVSARPLLTVIDAAPRQGFGMGRKPPEGAALAYGGTIMKTSAVGGNVWVSRQ